MTNDHNLYLHVPFCASKCRYCAFYSIVCANPDWDGFRDGILAEIDGWHSKLGKVTVPTIFFGGGTPSLMPPRVFAEIIEHIKRRFIMMDDVEISLESNPGTIDKDKLVQFQSAGMNRLSIGIQSLKDDELKFLGRGHNADDARRLIQDARDLGLRMSGDFIYGLPGQTVEDVQNLCRSVNDLGLEHCSMYELSIEQGTPFAGMNLQIPDNETMAEMYEAIGQTLTLARYEVSNYAEPGRECRHNQNIWDGQPYIGIGPGAAGRVLLDGIWYETKNNPSSIIHHPLSIRDRALEKVITGLRTIHGVRLTDDVRDVINWDYIEKHHEFFQITDYRLTTTEKGTLILNDLMVSLVK
jgi:oxygen-independent coproporphyrinogen-3 oxidase